VKTAVTAHPGEDVNLYPVGRTMGRRKGVHAVLDQDMRIGAKGPLCGVIRIAGEAVCGLVGTYTAPEDALFLPYVTCAHCVVMVRAEGIEIIGGSL